MSETQATIGAWGVATFGPITDWEKACDRIAVEAIEAGEVARNNRGKLGEELADVVIVVMNIAHQAGIDLQAEIDAKMAINRARQWAVDGKGNGQHK